MLLFPDLRRPQYPSSPEILLSALAWSTIKRTADANSVGLIYNRVKGSGSNRVDIHSTKPQGESLNSFCAELLKQGIHDDQGRIPKSIGEAFANSLEGTRQSKGVGYSSSSVGIAGALLQDPIGGLGVQNPPNFAQLINSIYRLGGADTESTAASSWFGAAQYQSGRAPLSKIEAALFSSVLSRYLDNTASWPPKEPILSERSNKIEVPAWWKLDVTDPGISTPFSWFRVSWDRLCSEKWREQLAPRRWASWAICLLRQGLAFTFLWEANFYFELARGIVDQESDPATVTRQALVPTRPLIPHRAGSISQMDVKPTFKKMLEIGLGCKNAILAMCAEDAPSGDSLPDIVEHLRRSLTEINRTRILTALSGSGDVRGIPNLIETVHYSLIARESEGRQDDYSLLRTVSRRFYHVAPGAEWIVVMSAMSAPAGPGSTVRLGDLMQSLKGLGFQPRIDFLLAALERAGLCASAPDGDEGIEINLGFGGE